MIKKYMTDKTHDNTLLYIENVAFIIMIICVLAFFPVFQFIPILTAVIFIAFLVSAFLGFGIIIIWVLRDFWNFKDNVYPEIYEEKQQEKRKKGGLKK